MERRAPIPLAEQVKTRVERSPREKPVLDGSDQVISTGSTLLDLAISGSRFEKGGIPGGIMVEIFGPSGAGKTVLLCEMAGAVQRQGGEVMFSDPEGRLNAQFAQLFDFKVENAKYDMANTVTELFEPIRKWEPKFEGINAVFADSLAALSTNLELNEKDGDKYGMRRAKEFSEECRKVCRVLPQRNILLVCSNQVRQNPDAGLYGEKFKSPGGEAIGFYASLRLRCSNARKIYRERSVGKGTEKRVVGVETTIRVHKSSVDRPFREAEVSIIYDYGVDDVRANLEYIKAGTGATTYLIGVERMGVSLDRAIRTVEDGGLESRLKAQVIELWRETEAKFKVERVVKRRT